MTSRHARPARRPSRAILGVVATTSRSELKPAYLICGSDTPKVRRAAARLRRRVLEDTGSDLNLTFFDARAERAHTVIESANTAAFVVGTRLILVLNADRWTVGERGVVADYLADPAPGTCLALVGETFAKTERLTKAVVKTGEVLRFDLPKRAKLNEWARKQAASRGLQLDERVAQRLLDTVGDDAERLESEIAKLATYVGGGAAAESDVDAVCVPGVERKVFDLTDAVGNGDRREALRCLELLYAHGEQAGSAFYAVLRHLRNLETVAQLPAQTPPGEIAGILKVHPFAAEKLARQRANFDRRTLGLAMQTLADAEVGMKGASQLEPEFVLEMAVARLVGARPS